MDGYEVIQSAPTSYVVDEARGVRDPSGMFCQRIGVTMHAVAVKPSPLQNLKLAVERCHLTVAAALFAPYASGLATLTTGREAARCHRDRHGRRRLPPSPCSWRGVWCTPMSCRPAEPM